MNETVMLETFGLDKDEIVIQPTMGTGYKPVLIEKRRILDVNGKILRKEYDVRVDMYNISDKHGCNKKIKELNTITVSSLDKINYSEEWDECCDELIGRKEKKSRSIILHRQAVQMEFVDVVYIDRLGLIDGADVLYVYCKDKVVSRSITEKRFFFAEEILDFGLKGNVNSERKIQCFQEIMTCRTGVLDIMFCVRLLSVLKPLLNMSSYPERFMVMIYGEFGSGKTEYSKAMFLANEMQLMNFTRDNVNPLKKKMMALHGQVLLLDDYHPTEQGHWDKKQKANLDLVSRFADRGDGALVVATGEYLEGEISLQDRMIPIYVDKNPDIIKSITKLKTMKAPLEELICEFALKVYQQKEEILEMVNKFCENWDTDNQKFRISRNKNYLYLAMCIFNKIFPDAMSVEFDGQLKKSIAELEIRQLGHMEKIRRLVHEIDWTDEVYRMLDRPEIPREYGFDSKFSKNKELIINEKKVYITVHELGCRMSQYLSMRVNVKEISEHLEMTGVLETDNSKSRTKKVQGKYYYVINRPELELYHLNKEK